MFLKLNLLYFSYINIFILVLWSLLTRCCVHNYPYAPISPGPALQDTSPQSYT